MKSNHYLSEKELHCELIICMESGQYSRRLHNMFKLMVDKYSSKFRYKDETWREDCKAFAYERLYRGYRSYNCEGKPFAFITQIIKMAMSKQFNDLTWRKDRGLHLDVTNFSTLFQKEINI